MIHNPRKNRQIKRLKGVSASDERIKNIITTDRADALKYSKVQKQICTTVAKTGDTTINEIDRQKAIQKLQRIGILDSDGKISEPYRSKKV